MHERYLYDQISKYFETRFSKFLKVLKFEDHVNFMRKKASQKLYALSRIAPFVDLKQRRNIMKTFVQSQFGYCPLIWMFHSGGLHNKINCIYERALRITYKDKSSTFQELLEKDNSVSIHQRNVQKLTTEICKVLHGFSPPIINSVRHGTESISCTGPKIF